MNSLNKKKEKAKTAKIREKSEVSGIILCWKNLVFFLFSIPFDPLDSPRRVSTPKLGTM